MDTAITQRLWVTSPAIAAVAGTLATALHADPDVLEQVESACGDNVRSILREATDPASATPRFDAAAERYRTFDAHARELLRGAAAFVPKALLDVDTRAVSATSLLEQDRTPQFEELGRRADRVVNEIGSLLPNTVPEATRALRARLNPDGKGGWRHLPVLSLGLALVARCAARGDDESGLWIRRQQSMWAELAAIAPEMVALDLVLAEVTLSGAELRKGSIE
jgi:hypothetical protein